MLRRPLTRAGRADRRVTATPGTAAQPSPGRRPTNGGSPITSYTVTPYIGCDRPDARPRSPASPPTSATITGLTNGTTYTFTVSATNSVGTEPAVRGLQRGHALRGRVAPRFVQSALSARDPRLDAVGDADVGAHDGQPADRGDGYVESSGATAKSVTDSAGNRYMELLHFKASDNTEMSVWSAPDHRPAAVPSPTITVTPTSEADVGMAALEYSGLSTVADATVVDQMEHGIGDDERRGHGLVGRDAGDDRGQRAGDRLLRRLGIRGHADRRAPATRHESTCRTRRTWSYWPRTRSCRRRARRRTPAPARAAARSG